MDFTIIRLSNGMHAAVDYEDFHIVEPYIWHVYKSRGGACYARARLEKGGKFVAMHRLILGVSESTLVDHRDNDGLNNRRGNLRACTHAQNMQNRRLRSDSSSGAKNVMWEGRYWRVVITTNGRRHRKCFQDFDEACRYADEKRRKLHGEFAYDEKVDARL